MMLPRIQPIIPTRRREPIDDPDWLFEFKHDGFRGPGISTGAEPGSYCNGNPLTCFDALADQLAASLDLDEAILDGEVT